MARRIRKILVLVTLDTWPTPCWSRSKMPIFDGGRPFREYLHTFSATSLAVSLSHDGGVRRYGLADLEMPLPLPYILPPPRRRSTKCSVDSFWML